MSGAGPVSTTVLSKACSVAPSVSTGVATAVGCSAMVCWRTGCVVGGVGCCRTISTGMGGGSRLIQSGRGATGGSSTNGSGAGSVNGIISKPNASVLTAMVPLRVMMRAVSSCGLEAGRSSAKPAGRLLEIVTQAAIILFAAILIRYSFGLIERTWDVESIALPVSSAALYVVMPLAGLALILQALAEIGDVVAGRKIEAVEPGTQPL